MYLYNLLQIQTMDIVQSSTPSLSMNVRRVKTDLLTSENIFMQTGTHNSLYGSTTLYKSRSPIDNNNNNNNTTTARISPPKLSRLKPPQDNRWKICFLIHTMFYFNYSVQHGHLFWRFLPPLCFTDHHNYPQRVRRGS